MEKTNGRPCNMAEGVQINRDAGYAVFATPGARVPQAVISREAALDAGTAMARQRVNLFRQPSDAVAPLIASLDADGDMDNSPENE